MNNKFIYNNGRSIKFSLLKKTFLKIIKDDKKIISVNSNNKKAVAIGDNIDIILKNDEREYSTFYTINFIDINNNTYILSEFKESQTDELLLPLLKLSKAALLYDYDFCGSFTKYNNHHLNNEESIIYLLYRWNPFAYYQNLIKSLQSNSHFIEMFTSEDNRFDVLVFQIPKVFQYDIKAILDSKYLKLSNFAKRTIIEFNNNKYITNTIGNSDQYRLRLGKKLNAVIPKKIALYPRFNKMLSYY